MEPTMSVRRLASTAAVALLAAAALAGCSGGGSSGGGSSSLADTSGSAESSVGSAPKAAGALDASGGTAARDAAGDTAGSPATGSSTTITQAELLSTNRSIVYTGDLTVRVRSVAAALDRAESMAASAGGFVFAENTTREPGRRGATTAQLTVKVPAARFRPTLDRLAGMGKALSRQQTADDVTSQVVDVESRLRTQRRSVTRMQALLDRATTVGEIVRVEGELSRREADLEALEAQQASLQSLTELATIDVTLVGPRSKPVVKDDDPELGFLAGLRGGIGAIVAVAVVALTAAGAVLPFAIVLGLVGVPVLLVLRRRRVAAPAVEAPPAA